MIKRTFKTLNNFLTPHFIVIAKQLFDNFIVFVLNTKFKKLIYGIFCCYHTYILDYDLINSRI